MAFSYPVALHFPAMRRDLLPQRIDDVVAALKRTHRVVERFREYAAELVFEQFSAQWMDTVEFPYDYASAGTAIARGKWLRLSFELRLGSGFYEAELYTFPRADDPQAAGVQLNFGGRAYAAVYEFQPRVSGQFDERAKKALLAACCTVAAGLDADAFMLLPEDGRLASFSSIDIVGRLRHPEISLNGRRAGLITGAKRELISVEELGQVWRLSLDDPRLMATSSFSVLDLLQRFTDE